MNKILLILPAVAAFFLFGLSAKTHATSEAPHAAVQIEHAYSFATAPSQKNGVVLFTIHNKADKNLRITSAHVTPDIADRAELHTHIMEGDTMMMREVEGYDIPAGEHITLAPMGDHIMLMNLLEPLEIDEHISMTLGFDDGSMTQFDAPVIAPGTTPEGTANTATSETHEHTHDHQDHSHH